MYFLQKLTKTHAKPTKQILVKHSRVGSVESVLCGILGLIFSIFWTYMAVSSDAPFMFSVFDVMFLIMMIVNIVKNYKSATGDNIY